MVLHNPNKMYRHHSITEGQKDSLVLYEATGFTRWDEAYGINEDVNLTEDIGFDKNESESSTSSASEIRESSSGPSEDRSTTSNGNSSIPDYGECKNEIIGERNLVQECATGNSTCEQVKNCDAESEDEINREPISAKEVIEHNKLFGYKTADYWWVHEDKVYSDYFTAYLRPMTLEEIAKTTKEDIKELKKELANEASLSENLEDFDKLLSRFEVKLNRQPSIPTGDPNLFPFPTPHDFIPTDLRKWLFNWEPFDLELEPLPCTEYIIISDPSDNLSSVFRPWLDDWKPFNTEIDGESAWKCLKSDLIKDDVLTNKQKQLLESRGKRTDLEDKTRMARRRSMIASNFKEKYHLSDCDLEKFSNFIPSLEESSEELLSLC